MIHNIESFQDLITILQNSKSSVVPADFCLHKYMELCSVLFNSNPIGWNDKPSINDGLEQHFNLVL